MLKTTTCVLVLLTLISSCASFPLEDNQSLKEIQSAFGPAFDEIVVDTSLTVRRKNGQRQARTKIPEATKKNEDKKEIEDKKSEGVAATVTVGKREKRQVFPGTGFGGIPNKHHSRNRHQQGLNNKVNLNKPVFPSGSAAAANAQAQGFNANGPLGSFGAQATGTQTQSFNFGPNGINGAAGISGSQAYQLPNGQSINVNFGSTYSVGPDGKPAIADSSALTITNPNGQKQTIKG